MKKTLIATGGKSRIMNYASIIIPLWVLGMFIYGMQIMAQGLENAAGSRMKSTSWKR